MKMKPGKILTESSLYVTDYESDYCEQLAELFYQTVHTVNTKDYTKEQLDVWADGNVDLKQWDKSFLAHNNICIYYRKTFF